MIGVGEICWASSEEKLWEELVLFDSPFVFLSSNKVPSVFDPNWETTATSRLLGLRGALGLFSGGRAVDFIPVGLQDLLERSEAEKQVRVRDLVLGIQSNPNLIGFAVGGDYLGNPEGIRLEPLSMAGDPPSVRLLLSKQSDSQHLLARLGAVLAEAARAR